jgi:hypothetical protein
MILWIWVLSTPQCSSKLPPFSHKQLESSFHLKNCGHFVKGSELWTHLLASCRLLYIGIHRGKNPWKKLRSYGRVSCIGGGRKTGGALYCGDIVYVMVMLQGSPDAKFFCQPKCLTRLARFTLEAHCSVVTILIIPLPGNNIAICHSVTRFSCGCIIPGRRYEIIIHSLEF